MTVCFRSVAPAEPVPPSGVSRRPATGKALRRGRQKGALMQAPFYATLYDLEQQAVKAERRDLLPDIELAYWLLHHVWEQLATDMQSGGRSAQAPEVTGSIPGAGGHRDARSAG